MPNLRRSLVLRIAGPVIVLALILGISLYFLVVTTISGFAQDKITQDLQFHSHVIYTICNRSFDEILHSGLVDDPDTLIIRQALTLGQIEDFLRQQNLEGLVYNLNDGELLLVTDLPMNPKKIMDANHRQKPIVSLGDEAKDYFAHYFDFDPWDWQIVILKNEREYAGLVKQVQQAHLYTFGLLILSAFLLVFFLYQSIKRPISAIIEPIKKSRRPQYKGIDVFEFLSENIARMMDSLQQSEEKYRLLFSQMIDGFALYEIICDSNGIPADYRILEINKAFEKIVGLKREEILNKTIFEIFPDTEKYWIETFGRVALTGEPIHFKRYSKELNKHLEGIAFSHQKGLFATTVTDTTERIEADKEQERLRGQLQQAHKMEAIGTLTGGIAHDFNNILSIIIGNTELALDDVPEWNPARFNLEEIQKAGMRAKDVVRQLLSFSRKTELMQKPINLIPIIKDSIRFLRATIPRDVEIRQNIQDTVDTVLADPTQIHQIIINLCTNAFHAMQDSGGMMEVGIENIVLDQNSAFFNPDLTPGQYVKLTVSDTGRGIDAQSIERIFDPYFTTKEVGKGSGMGLSVVHGIVKSHNGAITVQSELDKGSVFSLFFPVNNDAVEQETEVDEILPQGNERILFVDDEDAVVLVGRYRLERLGYTVETQTNPGEALKLFRTHPDPFDLVITDMSMPKMTGDQLAKEILKIRPDIPIILCTGYSEKIDEEKAAEIGIRQYIEKPVNQRTLAHLVRQVLDEK